MGCIGRSALIGLAGCIGSPLQDLLAQVLGEEDKPVSLRELPPAPVVIGRLTGLSSSTVTLKPCFFLLTMAAGR